MVSHPISARTTLRHIVRYLERLEFLKDQPFFLHGFSSVLKHFNMVIKDRTPLTRSSFQFFPRHGFVQLEYWGPGGILWSCESTEKKVLEFIASVIMEAMSWQGQHGFLILRSALDNPRFTLTLERRSKNFSLEYSEGLDTE